MIMGLLLKYKRIVKYLIAGSAGAFTNLVFLYIFTEFIGLWYLISTSLAFVIAFCVSFFLQKFWTFRDGNSEIIYKQMAAYFSVALANLGLNGLLMYFLVDGFGIWYMLAQLITSGSIAIESYWVYKKFIFNRDEQNIVD
ncbi:MAG: hypothetical protein AUK20_03045 [Parcubacteria group bacterium CG2_30_45_37]|nr:MAG: hypothetical protein AUK20_03045 [Parcubacteria group bacterium CG2_30_45_37]